MYKPVRLDAQGRVVRLGAQGKAEQQLGGVEWLGGVERRLGGVERRLGGAERRLGGAEWRLGGAGEAAELCGAAELLGVPLTITPLSELHQPDAKGRGGIGRKGMEPKAKA